MMTFKHIGLGLGLLLMFIVSLSGISAHAASASKGPPLPVIMDLKSPRDYMKTRGDIILKAQLWAAQPVTLCLYPEHPEANFTVEVFRGGYGKVEFTPTIVQLSPQEQKKIQHIRLEPGQMHQVMFNLKKLLSGPPSYWQPGEYRIQAKFFLCGSAEYGEKEIPSRGPLHLLLLD